MHRVCKSETFERPQNILMQRFMSVCHIQSLSLSEFVESRDIDY